MPTAKRQRMGSPIREVLPQGQETSLVRRITELRPLQGNLELPSSISSQRDTVVNNTENTTATHI